MSSTESSQRQVLIGILDEEYEKLSKDVSVAHTERGPARHSLLVRGDGSMLEAMKDEIRDRLLRLPGGPTMEEAIWVELCRDIDTIFRQRKDTLSASIFLKIEKRLRSIRVRVKDQLGYEHRSLRHQ